jgi:hypothetical protein
MKNIFSIFCLMLTTMVVSGQDFSKNMASAKSSYSSGDLENARFSMQQMITDLDMAIGKEILKLLPTKMDAMAANTKSDNVTANTGITGVLIHRDYGTGERVCNIEIMGNSPLVASLNAMLSLPFMNSGDGTQKVIKIEGYKGVLQKSINTDNNKTDFTLQVPVNATLLTFTVPDSNETDVIKFANTIPLSQIAKMVQ